MMLIVEILLIVNRYKMENLKTNWELLKKTKNPRSPTGNWLQENWKHSENSRKKLKFSLKNCKIGRQGRENSPQSVRQKSPTALKRLDISIKRTLKIGHRLCWFCAMQQRKKPVTFFMSQALGAPEGIRTPGTWRRRTTTQRTIRWYAALFCWFCTATAHLSQPI